jgi:hypothetical protein
MALTKEGLNIPFGQGLDLKTDPNQVAAGKMLALSNVVFDKGGSLEKRNGFPLLTTLPITTNTVLTTYKGNLVSTGANLYAYASGNDSWLNRGTVQPVNIETQSLIRNSNAQSQGNAAIASNGLLCTVYTEGSSSYYTMTQNGQVVQAATALPASATYPRVFLFNNSFAIVYSVTTSLFCLMIPLATPSSTGNTKTLSTTLAAASAFDATVSNTNNILYYAWQDSVSTSVKVNGMNYQRTLVTVSGRDTTKDGATVAITADESGSLPVVWVSSWGSGDSKIWSSAWSDALASTAILAATDQGTYSALNSLVTIATSNTLSAYYSLDTAYSYVATITPYIAKTTVDTAGTVVAGAVIRRSVRVASKPFYLSNGASYIFGYYSENETSIQPTLFLLDTSGNILARMAGSNAAANPRTNVQVVDDVIYFAYAIKSFVTSINDTQGAVQAPGGLFTQAGINIATITINASQQNSSEIGQSLHLTGGQLWQFDGVTPVEHGFHVYPESIVLTKANSSGTIDNGTYYYRVCYEWTDNNGLLHRSAPSLPYVMVLGGAEDTITVNVPTLRLTAKSNVRIVVYRWSAAQPVYYQVSSITAPTANSTTTDSVAFVDTLPDASILGNTLLYTTGGVIENIAAPASFLSTLFKSRLFLVSSENRNLIWYSKQVIEATPVEMSDLLTIYVSPTSGAQGSTGDITALSSMDDKLIVFKRDAIYYVTGTGPDNTGANNDFSEPVYITGTVGCSNQDSITQTPQGLMFQSDKGIWLLGRDLSTSYVGAPMETYNTSTVTSALTIPATNQVRFTLSSGTVLMYDYYFAQWATFDGIPGVSSCLYNSLHTYLNGYGQVMQESLSSSLDYSTPVTISFTTAWLKLTNLQGFQRAYFFYLLGTYLSPHKLNISIAYDYDPAVKQTVTYTPPNVFTTYGDAALYGSDVYGGSGSPVEQFRVFLSQQRCQAIQITVQEAYDPSKGQVAGGGLNLSGLNLVVGAKKGFPVLPATKSVG